MCYVVNGEGCESNYGDRGPWVSASSVETPGRVWNVGIARGVTCSVVRRWFAVWGLPGVSLTLGLNLEFPRKVVWKRNEIGEVSKAEYIDRGPWSYTRALGR